MLNRHRGVYPEIAPLNLLPVGCLVFSGQIDAFLRFQQSTIVAEVVNTSGCVLQCKLLLIDLIKARREVKCPFLCVGRQYIMSVP